MAARAWQSWTVKTGRLKRLLWQRPAILHAWHSGWPFAQRHGTF
jgi:hypothetical protein